MSDHPIRFVDVDLSREGKVLFENEKIVMHSQVLACPHVILRVDHYREDGSCRCDDPDHVAMRGWGYTWDGVRWT